MSKSNRASSAALGNLHIKLAEVMQDALGGEKFIDPETGEEMAYPANNPALFTAVAKFLKDNDIVAIPETEDAITSLRNQLNASKRPALPTPTKDDMQWPQGKVLN
jgi:hypothetical protein